MAYRGDEGAPGVLTARHLTRRVTLDERVEDLRLDLVGPARHHLEHSRGARHWTYRDLAAHLGRSGRDGGPCRPVLASDGVGSASDYELRRVDTACGSRRAYASCRSVNDRAEAADLLRPTARVSAGVGHSATPDPPHLPRGM